MTISQVYDKFIFDKKLAGLTESSLKDYYYCLKGFISYVSADLNVGFLTLEMVQGYILMLLDSGKAKGTISTYIRYARIFLMYIHNHWQLPFNPTDIVVPKSPKKKVDILDPEALQHLFWSIKATPEWVAARNRAIVALMLDSGIRQGEVCSLQIKNVFFTSRKMKVYGKGDKERFVPLGDLAMRYLQKYIEMCPYVIVETLFLDVKGGMLSKNAVRVFMNRLKHSTGLDVTSHKLRHNFATNFCIDKVEAGGQVDTYSLKILMGHESISTTEKYLHCAMEELAVKSSISHLDKISGLP